MQDVFSLPEKNCLTVIIIKNDIHIRKDFIMEDSKVLSPRETAELIMEALDSKKGVDIKLLGVTEKTVIADYFVLCTGTSTTHVKSLADEVEFRLEQVGLVPQHSDGTVHSDWMVLDYGSVIVHVFLPKARDFYNLEKLWDVASEIPAEANK